MKACCCPLRIGALCGLGGALVWNIALAGFLWSGFTGFDNDSADRADRFCSYDEDVTMATHTNYRAASVCSHEADPCMKDGVKLTHDDFLAQGQIGQGLGGFFQTQFLAQILFCIIGLVGVGLKNKMISKIAVGLIVILLIGLPRPGSGSSRGTASTTRSTAPTSSTGRSGRTSRARPPTPACRTRTPPRT
jgi:hypothetical protein